MTMPPPPPPPSGPPVPPPPPEGAGSDPMTAGVPGAVAEHPDAQKALVLAILGLLCCGPLAIWSFIITNGAKQQGPLTGKMQTAWILSIVALALWALAIAAGGLR